MQSPDTTIASFKLKVLVSLIVRVPNDSAIIAPPLWTAVFLVKAELLMITMELPMM